MLGASMQGTTASSSTSQAAAIFRQIDSGSGRSARRTSASGVMPIERSWATECCVGFVLSSPLGARYGTSETWMKRTLSRPRS